MISLYKNTEQEGFPLILVIGKGVNDDLPMNDKNAHYDLKNVLHSELRYAAYRIVARSKGTSVKFLMELCKLKQSSILVFVDIGPAMMSNAARKKNLTEDRIGPEDYVRHVKRVMTTGVFDRAAMVIISGLGEETYRKAVQTLDAESRAQGKIVARPLLLSENREYGWTKIKRDFSYKELDYVAAIFDRWMTHLTYQYLERYTGRHNLKTN